MNVFITYENIIQGITKNNRNNLNQIIKLDMMLRKYFYFALLVLASVWLMPSCSEDDVVPPVQEEEKEDKPSDENGENVHVPNPAGDDFYKFVNGEWHESLTDLSAPQGYSYDIAKLLAAKTLECYKTYEPAILIQESLANLLAGGQDANLQRMYEIIEELLADVETKTDAYRAIGKMVGMGLIDSEIRLYMYPDEGIMHYAVVPPQADEEGEEEEAEIRSMKHRKVKKLKKYSGRSRSTDDAMNAILEGLGMDPDYFLYDESIVPFLTKLEESSLDELKELINGAVVSELLPFCGDEYVAEITQGAITSTMDMVNALFEELFKYSLSHHFSQTYLTEELKGQYAEYGEELRSVFAKRIENNAWLSTATKQAALAKLNAMKFFFGEPDVWYEEGFPVLKGELLVDDILEAKASNKRLVEAVLGKNHRDESFTWGICQPGGSCLNKHDAYYSVDTNAMHIHPSFLMAPEYAEDMEPGKVYASFYVMGHEMTHGFDLDGSTYDGEGQENNWWAAEDRAKFEALNNLVIEQIGTFEVAEGIFANSSKTVTEDVADMGGMNIAFDALTAYLTKKGVSGDELKEAQKDFFEHHAYRYRTYYTPKALQEQLADEHSVDMVRVNGIVQHMDSWYELYNVVEGDALYLPKEERIVIW